MRSVNGAFRRTSLASPCAQPVCRLIANTRATARTRVAAVWGEAALPPEQSLRCGARPAGVTWSGVAPAGTADVTTCASFVALAAAAVAAVAVTGFLPAGLWTGVGLPPGMPRGYESARNGLAGSAEYEHPARWPSLTTAPHFSQTRHAQQAGSPPSSACPDPAGDRAWLAARRGSAAGSLLPHGGWSLVISVPP